MRLWPKKKTKAAAARRPPLAGTVSVAGTEWNVHEEKRQGPRSQLLVYTRPSDTDAAMHVRPPDASPAQTLEDAESLAADPLYRWFVHAGRRWEARLVVRSEPETPDVMLVKFIAGREVFEGEYPHRTGLGLRTDAELIELLEQAKGS